MFADLQTIGLMSSSEIILVAMAMFIYVAGAFKPPGEGLAVGGLHYLLAHHCACDAGL